MSDTNITIPTGEFTIKQLEQSGMKYAKARNLVNSWLKSGKVQLTGTKATTGKRGKPSPFYRQVAGV